MNRRRPIVPLTDAQQQQVLAYRHLVTSWVRTLRTPPQIDREDLIAEGTIGLMHAVQRFDHRRGVSFVTFASTYVRSAMLEYLRRQDPLTRSDRQVRRHLEQAEGRWIGDEQLQAHHLWRQVDPHPSPEDLAVTRLTAQVYQSDLARLPLRSQAIFSALVMAEAQVIAVARQWRISRTRVGQIQAVTVEAIRQRRKEGAPTRKNLQKKYR